MRHGGKACTVCAAARSWGLRWFDISIKAKTLTVDQARVLVDYEVRIEEPKSRNGMRTLPLDDAEVAALADLRKCQAKEGQRLDPLIGRV